MQEKDDVVFLLNISKQIKAFLETSVIFLNRIDYAEIICNTLWMIHEALQKNDENHVLELIAEFHLQWLHAVKEIEKFYKTDSEVFSKDNMCQAISFTIDAFNTHVKHFQEYIDKNKNTFSPDVQTNLNTDLEIIEEMHAEVTHSLLEKIKNLRTSKTDIDFKTNTTEAANELLQWIDIINDELAMKLCKYINLRDTNLTGNLTKALQKIIYELKSNQDENVHKIFHELKCKGIAVTSMIRYTAKHSLEIDKITNKIQIIDDCIKRLEKMNTDKTSAAYIALEHKKQYLENSLEALENLKITLTTVHTMTLDDLIEEEICTCTDFFQLRIFNHFLPVEHRERLVSELCYLWDIGIFGDRSNKSVISILSATNVKEEFTDELGTFYIDRHSRKIYKLPNDETRYQPNEHHELVPVADDADHIYFYDDCGRYYMNAQTKQRIYKAHATASEYMMDSFGVLLKVKEERNGTTYYYDNYGPYYINHEGKHIYKDPDGTSEYENDGLGNLVRIRSQLDIFEPCPDDAPVTEEFKYLKEVVGKALRVCIGKVLLYQPQDPIKCLSECLIKYRENIELKDKRTREKEELNKEREIITAEEQAAADKAAMEAALLMQGGSETSYDSNFLKYDTFTQDYII